ncbi:hypothetical protein Lfu02_64350 [Longispora fulva]|uniref:Putative repeat protein (TIGR01451 family) n=1 Tax=Longispora fulva TaxID=619741 RepID=A0A8J7KK88_9ACTN|nr:DUF11 domain-containing protein [Longispora fulva]MBG6137779.1 putative repeat protein (TIGR01451 family) [Longispora fulva]GIG62063.1 hypothetical protein Lfu02_64350 [Longispora fulva]
MYALRSLFPAILLGGIVLGQGAPAAAEPNLSIAVDDGRASVRAGERHEYTVTVRNAGTESAKLLVEVGVPVGVELTPRSHGAETDGTRVRWPVEVAPGGTTRVRLAGRAPALPDGQRRLALTACALPVRSGPAAACATDMNAVTTRPPVRPADPAWSLAGGAGAVLLVAGGGAWAWRRRRAT